ncbi:MAG TPA: alcohol dehydrogenase catalytic domain-containing protein, partial [Candidatus Tumulicola sp.]|nr:alcohol dehydrogenase catalytic domain-containing protein [Candidatus Tumulicola sp.]
MMAAVRHAGDPPGRLRIESAADPAPAAGDVLLRVRACGVCRTDLHVVDAELPPRRERVIPGHQIVGDVVAAGDGVDASMRGRRVGVSWLGGIDGTCDQCRAGRENLCDAPTYTGYTRDGGYAQYAVARADFAVALPDGLDDRQAAPLLCAGIVGFRALRVAGVQPGERVGLFGFGASAHLALPVLRDWACSVYVATRGRRHR